MTEREVITRAYDEGAQREYARLVQSPLHEAEWSLIIDLVDSSNILLDVSTIRNFDDYQFAPFIAEAIWMSKEEVKAKWGAIPSGTKEYSLNKNETSPEKVGMDRKTTDEGRQNIIKVFESCK